MQLLVPSELYFLRDSSLPVKFDGKKTNVILVLSATRFSWLAAYLQLKFKEIKCGKKQEDTTYDAVTVTL